MQQTKTILRNGNLVFEDQTLTGDLVIEHGKIAASWRMRRTTLTQRKLTQPG